MSDEYERLTREDLNRMAAGDPVQLERLRTTARLAGASSFAYPGKGPVVVFFSSDGSRVRLSDGGRLIKYLESQGMDLAMDEVISKTVYHVVHEFPGAAMGSGEIYLDSTPDAVVDDLPRFLQLVIETIGLRHAKYKDAVVKLAAANDGGMLKNWER
jgi:hypothetical protein